MTSPTTALWHSLLHSSAIAYIPPDDGDDGDDGACCSSKNEEFYWHPDLLHQWQSLLKKSAHHHDASSKNNDESSSSTIINYASLMLLAVYTADELRRKLSLQPATADAENAITEHSTSLRIGMAIPEGPMLPLFVLVIHSLNIAVAERWLTIDVHNDAKTDDGDGDDGTKKKWCKGVVLIPMETDEAPERLKHIVTDSSPHLILVANGDDRKSLENALALGQQQQQSTTSTHTQLVDFIELIKTALSSIMIQQQQQQQDNNIYSLMEKLWTIDNIRERTTVMENSSWDVARLVAIGCARLATTTSRGDDSASSFTSLPNYTTSSLSSSSSSNRTIMSHIVYTSGTTGLPKGCISSLSSLQHYIRAKNIAHDINSQSNVMLASAVTFDPCFSDVLSTFWGNGTLCLAPRAMLYGHGDGGGEVDKDEEGGSSSYRGLTKLLRQLRITHVLCTPSLWAMVEGAPPRNIPSLQVVALGGEPVPKSMRSRWARKWVEVDTVDSTRLTMMNREYPRLFATYGVTEACVYQTWGEVIEEMQPNNGTVKSGQSVGLPLLGTNVSICRPLPEDDIGEENELLSTQLEKLEEGEDESDPVIGEVVLSGEQVDVMSSYLNLSELTRRVFVQSSGEDEGSTYFYRTGDLGYIDKNTGELHINGRIKGDGMVKINGIRIELSEIESSVIDDIVDDKRGLVIDCMAAVATPASAPFTDNDDNQHKQLIAYCILSGSSISQLGIKADRLKAGVIVPQSPLLSLLRARCDRRVRKGCTPSFFVIIDRLPLSPTGKRNRSALPVIEKCSVMSLSAGDYNSTSLWKYGVAGPIVAEKICECLNLQQCQKSLVTTSSSFFILGGDSLAATRVTRGLYASHHNVNDSRNLGGSSGTLDGPFAAKFLLKAGTLGEYCEFLDSHSAFCSSEEREGSIIIKTDVNAGDAQDSEQTRLFGSLIESITLGHSNVSLVLLDYVDPNIQPIKARLGKVTDRKQQRSLFKSNPLHLACIQGDAVLVRALLDKGCKANLPDASGAFPIHLACSHLERAANSGKEDLNRRECVRMLLEDGTPIAIKDGNKQTILHSAARSGHVKLLTFILKEWQIASNAPNGIKFKSHGNLGSIYDWHDRWYRTPVHWAILNKRVETLQVLLDGGCSATPSKPKQGVSKRSTNVLIESPLKMCQRLYGEKEGVGKEISTMLNDALVAQKSFTGDTFIGNNK